MASTKASTEKSLQRVVREIKLTQPVNDKDVALYLKQIGSEESSNFYWQSAFLAIFIAQNQANAEKVKHLIGRLIKTDREKAAIVIAQMATFFELGQRVSTDISVAMNLYEEAMNLGNYYAQLQYALGHLLTRGTSYNAKRGKSLVKKLYTDNPPIRFVTQTNRLVWRLCTSSDPELRDPETGMKILNSTQEYIRLPSTRQQVLAACLAATGKYDEAVQYQKLAVKYIDEMLDSLTYSVELLRHDKTALDTYLKRKPLFDPRPGDLW